MRDCHGGHHMNNYVAAQVDGCPELCPACSYPSLVLGLCYFCRPLVETSVIVVTTARQSPAPHPDDERGLSSSAASAFAAAG